MCSTSKSRTRAPHLLLKMSTGHSSVRLNRFTSAESTFASCWAYICRIFGRRLSLLSPTIIHAATKFPRTYVRTLVRTTNKNVPKSPKTSFPRLLHVFICIFQIFVVILRRIWISKPISQIRLFSACRWLNNLLITQ